MYLAMFAAASVLVAVGYYAVTSLSTNLRERDALHYAQAYLVAMALARQYYAETIVPRIKQNNVPISHHYKDTERALPVPATVSKDLSARIHNAHKEYRFGFFSLYPFKGTSGNTELTPLQRQTIEYFQSTGAGFFCSVEQGETGKQFYFAQPIVMKKNCIACHNSHPDSVKTDWKVGDLRGTSSIQWKMQPVALFSDPAMRWPLVLLLVTIAMAIGGAVVLLNHHAARSYLANALKKNRELALARKAISTLAYTDSLTGLANRRHFEEHLEKTQNDALERTIDGFSLILIDLYKLKSINDQHGHPVGDEVIKDASARIRDAIDSKCFAARLGGDEFAIVAQCNGDDQYAIDIASNVEAAIRRPLISKCVDNLELVPRANFGVRTHHKDSDNPKMVLSDADVALYRSKLNRVAITKYCQSMRDTQEREMRLERDLLKGFERDQFELVIQPLISLRTMEVAEFEALARWQHPEFGCIMPDVFLPIVARLNLEEKFDLHVLGKAIDRAKEIENQTSRLVCISVNLSAVTCASATLLEGLEAVMNEKSGLPRQIGIEVTEHAIVNDFDAVNQNIKALRRLGLTVSLDDFGTGFSALSYLNSLEIDRLKIDKSFVNEMTNGVRPFKLIRTIFSLASQLDMKVVAEGVENSRQAFLLKSLGIKFGQGYLFSKPKKFNGKLPAISFVFEEPQSRAKLPNGKASA